MSYVPREPTDSTPVRIPPSLAEVRARARWRLLAAARDPANDEIAPVAPFRRKATLSDARQRAVRWLAEAAAIPGYLSAATFPPAPEVQLQRAAAKYNRTRLQDETAAWIAEGQFNNMTTLTFDSETGVSLGRATKIFGKFLPRLSKVVLRQGIRGGRVPMAPIIEDSREQLRAMGLTVEGREGTHLHVLMRLRGDDPYKYKDEIRKAWKATHRLCGDPKIHCPNSDQWFLPLTSSELRDTYGDYVLKQQATDTLGLLVQYLHLD